MTFSLPWLPEVLKAANPKVAVVDGWENRGRADIGETLQCDLSPPRKPKPNMPSLEVSSTADRTLAGPLSHNWASDATAPYVIAAGRCNHAGAGDVAADHHRQHQLHRHRSRKHRSSERYAMARYPNGRVPPRRRRDPETHRAWRRVLRRPQGIRTASRPQRRSELRTWSHSERSSPTSWTPRSPRSYPYRQPNRSAAVLHSDAVQAASSSHRFKRSYTPMGPTPSDQRQRRRCASFQRQKDGP